MISSFISINRILTMKTYIVSITDNTIINLLNTTTNQTHTIIIAEDFDSNSKIIDYVIASSYQFKKVKKYTFTDNILNVF